MVELPDWIAEDPVRFVVIVAVVLLFARMVWRRLTRKYLPLSAEQAAERLDDGQTLFLDVRTGAELHGGAIPAAMHIPKHLLRRRLADLEISSDTPIVVYCQSGMRSASAARILTRHGFSEVYNLQGGIAAWRAHNLPVSSDD
ncbi:rhodanese-like domain-containing protein [Halorhodospira halochloris]|uniref:rhodanese-like domain-containing protein n=1 Tax=Halorhodospira halochloris TaxID=1052 RepID=UPI001EE7AE17|nr:rhodanese-like domain-containing protein [Halorhodospira halochloris]MCG5530996.1 rhodanese-like domain-containing protein [Halorhodospira halochloris]MCG5548777.1 rhodanese-like domain-containing protein [Halorhodospira halochloris]